MVQATQSDISTLCGQNLLLWMQYLELVTFNKIITHHLAKEHHLHRVCGLHSTPSSPGMWLTFISCEAHTLVTITLLVFCCDLLCDVLARKMIF